MKIIVATRDLDYGAGSVVKYELYNFDKDKNIKKVIVIGPKKLDGYSNKISFEVIKNIGKYFVTKEPNFAFLCKNKIKEILKKEKIDEIHLHSPIYAEKFGPKLIMKFHTLHLMILEKHPFNIKLSISAIFHKAYSYFDFVTMKYSDKILFVSKKTLNEAKKLYPQFKTKFSYSPNKVNRLKFYKVNVRDRKRLKIILNFDKNKRNILYVGRLEPMKGILDLIDVIKGINNKKLKLVVVGDGPLKNKIQKYKFVDYRGKISNDDLYKYYNATDLFILPSHYENSPMTVLEAKACGCKILARDVGDNRFNLDKRSIFKTNKELMNKIK